VTILSVLILTQENCGFCDAAKTMLERLSREYPLTVSTLPLESAAGQELAVKGGILFPPGIFIDEKPCCYGRPSEARLRREIEQKLEQQRSA
jgi:glutaredoxin